MGRWRVRLILLVLLSSSLSAVGLSLFAPRPLSPQDANLRAAPPEKKAPQEDNLPPEVKPEKRPPPKAKLGPIRVTRLMTPEDAARLAVLDATRPPGDPLRINPSDLPFMRWVWVQRGDYEDGQGVRFVINLDSRSAFLKQAPIVTQNFLVRINLAHYADKVKDQIKLLEVWEQFQFSPAFSRLITKDEIGFLTPEQRASAPKVKREKKVAVTTPAVKRVRKETKNIKVDKVPFITPDDRKVVYSKVEVGTTYTFELEFDEVVTPESTSFKTVVEELSVLDVRDIDVIRFNSPAVPSLAALQTLTGSQAPVVELPYFVSRATTTIKDDDKDDKLFATVFGGLYYELRGIDKVDNKQQGFENATDEDLFFERLGIGNIKAGVTAKKLFDDLNSSQRTALFKSEVTGKPRAVDLFNTPQNGDSSPFGGISHDVNDKHIDQTQRAMKNLLDFKDDAREGIFPGNNGLPLFWMGNGQGVRQDEVPFNVALDSTIPHPYSQRLQVIGCIRCHGADGFSLGWKPLRNDARELFSAYGVDAFADLSELNVAVPETVARLVKKYQWRPQKQLMRARDDYSEKVLLSTGMWKRSKDQSDVVTLASQKVADIYSSYWYTTVTPRVALAELGYDIADDGQAAQVLTVLLPPDKRNRVGDIIPEDANIAALKQNIAGGILRSDWALSYSFALERSIPNRPLVEGMWLKP